MAKNLAPKNPTFDYALVTKEEKSQLGTFEGRLIRSRRLVAAELVKHGEVLYEAQQVLAKYHEGVFLEWLASVGISKSSAYRAIDVYLGFGSFPNWENLEVSAAYTLASNEKAKHKALTLIEKGIKVTHAMAKQLIAAVTPAPPKGDSDETTPVKGAAPAGVTHDREPAFPVTCVADDSGVLESPRADETLGKTESPPDHGKCPVCAGTDWTEEDGEIACAKCHHPHGEPAGDPDEDRNTTQRQKTTKTLEAVLRAFDDLQAMKPRTEHTGATKWTADDSLTTVKDMGVHCGGR